MIAIDIPMADAVSRRLMRSLGLASRDVKVVAEDDPETDGADVLVVMTRDAERLSKTVSPSIRWVHVLSTGVDGFPFGIMGDRLLTCSRGASAVAISEFVLASMLAFEKDFPGVWIKRADDWKDVSLGQLCGKTLGLIGIGAIGSAVAKRALAFEMEVAALRRSNAASPIASVEVTRDLEKVLGKCDHLVVAAPSTPDTRRLMDAKAFGLMKEGSHFVNISRGALVDQDALIDALDRGRVAMASLDVTDPEPLPVGHPLYSHPKVKLSAHVSWSAPSTLERSVELFEENYRRFLAREDLEGIVDLQAGY